MTAVLKNNKPSSTVVLRRGTALAMAAAPYITPKKVLNLLQCEIEKRRRIVRPRSFPYIAIIDITNTCNLRCPFCPTGDRRNSGRTKTMIDTSKVRQFIDEIGEYIISANLFNWGEPLLHPHLASIVRMVHDASIFTVISSNLNTNNRNLLNDICDAGLDYLTVSLSGASQEAYEQYHRKGNPDLVFENIRHIIGYRRKKRRKKPIIELKYLVFKHNRHEVETARQRAKEIGVDIFRAVRGGGEDEARVEEGQALERNVRTNFCHQLWHVALINADAGISPCCFLFFKEDDFAEYTQNSLLDIRQSKRFVTARKFFNPSSAVDLPPDLQHPCLKCALVHEQPHLQNYLKSNPNAKKGHRTGGP